MLKGKFITDTVPPVITASTLSAALFSPNGDGRLDTTTVRLTATGLTRFGWRVEPLLDGVRRRARARGRRRRHEPSTFTWDGRGAGRHARPRRHIPGHRLDRRRLGQPVAGPEARHRRHDPPGPDLVGGTGLDLAEWRRALRVDDRCGWGRTSWSPGKARILDKNGAAVRRWELTFQAEGGWTWDGKDAAGKIVPDGRYTFRVDGIDACGQRHGPDRPGAGRSDDRGAHLGVVLVPAGGRADATCSACGSRGRPR